MTQELQPYRLLDSLPDSLPDLQPDMTDPANLTERDLQNRIIQKNTYPGFFHRPKISFENEPSSGFMNGTAGRKFLVVDGKQYLFGTVWELEQLWEKLELTKKTGYELTVKVVDPQVQPDE